MIRHFVLLRFQDSVTSEIKAQLFDELAALRDHIAGIQDFRVHQNVSVEADLIHGFKDAFWFDFADEAVRDAYLVDPAHQIVGAKIGASTVGGGQGVVVFDMKI
uniref:Dabb family protein n=1 Tax=uncultured Rhizobium sp. TaxID=155567 RepID=UPI00260A3A44|nr:Dabb family protein [uncultured Rhizobium sp.]